MTRPVSASLPAIVRLGIYAGVTASAAFSTFLAGPVLVRLLGIEAFGTWSLIEPLVLMAAAAALLGVDHGLIKQVSHDGNDLSPALGRLVPIGLPVLLAVAGLAGIGIAVPVLGWGAVPALAVLIVVEAVLGILLFGCRAANRLAPYAIGQAGRPAIFLLALGIVLALTWPTRLSLMDIVLFRLLAAGSLALLLVMILRPGPLARRGAYADAVRYGGFILLTGMLAQVAESGDRFLLAWFGERADVGAYVVYVKLTAFVGQGITMPFMLWFPVERFAHLNDPDGGSAFFDQAAHLLLALMLTVAGMVGLAGHELVDLFAPGLAYDPWTLVLLIMAIVTVGMTYPFNVGLLKPGHTHRNLYPVGAGALAAIAIGAVLIPWLGLQGAALAKLGGAIVALGTLMVLSQRIHRVAFRHGRMVGLCLGTAMLGTLLGADPLAGLPLAVRLAMFLTGMAVVVGLTAGRGRLHKLGSLTGAGRSGAVPSPTAGRVS